MGGETIRLQAIPARTSCDDMLQWVGEEVLEEYKNLAHNRGLQGGNRSVQRVGAGSDGEAVVGPAGAEGGKGLTDDDNEDKPAGTAVCAFMAYNLHKGKDRGSWKPLQKVCKKRKKKEPRRVGDPPLSFEEFIRAHPQGCFVCYGRSSPFQHDHGSARSTRPTRRRTRKRTGPKKRTSANIREAKVELSEEELSKLMMVGTELAKEIQEIKRAWGPKLDNDKDKDNDMKGSGRWRKKSAW